MVQAGSVSDAERMVTEDQYAQIIERSDRALRIGDDDTKTMTLYDQVDGTPLQVEAQMAMQVHLKKVVAICSACRHPSAFNADIVKHIRAAVKNSEDHQNAEALEMVTQNGTGKRCTACDGVFLSRPNNVYEHIERAKQAGVMHQSASVQVIRRFSQEPLVVEKREPTPVESASPSPLGTEGDRSKPRSHRRRRRHHKGGSA
jgi:hypothetical protein